MSVGFTRQESWSGHRTLHGIVPTQGSTRVSLSACPGRRAPHHYAAWEAGSRGDSSGLTGRPPSPFGFFVIEGGWSLFCRGLLICVSFENCSTFLISLNQRLTLFHLLDKSSF